MSQEKKPDELTITCLTCRDSFTPQGYTDHIRLIEECTLCELCHQPIDDDDILYDHEPREFWGQRVYETIPIGYHCSHCGGRVEC